MTTATQKYPLLGTKIVLDEEKILRENQYDLEKMYKAIDEMASDCELIKIDKHIFHCKGDERDLACLGIFIHDYLKSTEWFLRNIKEWIWISEKEGDLDIIQRERSKGNYIGSCQ